MGTAVDMNGRRGQNVISGDTHLPTSSARSSRINAGGLNDNAGRVGVCRMRNRHIHDATLGTAGRKHTAYIRSLRGL